MSTNERVQDLPVYTDPPAEADAVLTVPVGGQPAKLLPVSLLAQTVVGQYDFSGLPTTPGATGTLWLNGGFLCVAE